jgi:hypothetical protein
LSCGNPENRFLGGQDPVSGCDGTRRRASRAHPKWAASESRLSGDGGLSTPAAGLARRNSCRCERSVAWLAGRHELSCCAAAGIRPDAGGLWPEPRQMATIRKGEAGESLSGIKARSHDQLS